MGGNVVNLGTYRTASAIASDKRREEYRAEAEKRYNELSGSSKQRIDLGWRRYLGFEKREGWSGYLPFYLFKCYSCRNLAKSYTQGYRGYLTCSSCGAKNGYVLWWRVWTILRGWYNRQFHSLSVSTHKEK